MNLVRARLPVGPLFRGTVVLAGGTAIGQFIVFLSAPVLTRLYQPQDFGVLATYTSLIGILSVVIALKYEVAIPLPRGSRQAANVLALSLLSVFCMAGAVAVAVPIVSTIWPSAGRSLSDTGIYWLLPLGLLGAGAYNVLSFWAVRKRDYHQLAKTKLSQATGQVFAQVGLGLAHFSPIGLLIGDFVGRSSGTVTLASSMWREDRRYLRAVRLRRIWLTAQRYWRFPALASVAGLLNSAGLHLAPLLLISLYGAQVAGWFALADRIIQAPMALIGRSIARVYFGEVAALSEAPARLQDMLERTITRLIFIIIGPTVLLAALGRPVFGFVFGSEWERAGLFAQLLSPFLFFKFITNPVAQHLNVLERQDLSMIWSGIRLIAVGGTLAIPAWLEMSPSWTIGFYSGGMSLCYVGLLLLNQYAIRDRIRKLQ